MAQAVRVRRSAVACVVGAVKWRTYVTIQLHRTFTDE